MSPAALGEDPADAALRRPGRLAPELAAALPALGVLVVTVVISQQGGGFQPTTWLPAALFCLALLLVVVLAGGSVRPRDRTTGLALAAFAAYTAWAFLSVSWAASRADAWQGANLTLLYLVAFTVLVVSPRSSRATAWLMVAYAVAIAAIGVWIVWKAASGPGDPDAGAMFGGRLSDPMRYPNATAAMFAIPLWAALVLVLQPRASLPLRITALASAAVLAELNLLCQSRGSIFTLPLVAVVYLVVSRRRLLAAAVLGVVGCALAIAAPALLHVYRADNVVARKDALSWSLVVMGVTAGAMMATGLALPLLDRVPAASPAARRRLRYAGAAAAAIAVAAAVALTAPGARLDRAWEDFKVGGVPTGDTHLSGLGSNRYDFWRVGLLEFRRQPLQGIGVDNFAVPYLQQRRSGEQPLYPHALWVRLLSQTGIVGTLLFGLFLGAAATAALRGRPAQARNVCGAALVGFVAWLLHAQVDWLWEMPALGMAAFAYLGLALGTSDDLDPVGAGARAGSAHRLALGAAGVALWLAAMGSVMLPWLAARYEKAAVATWRDDPGLALSRLSRAASLNPLDDRPYVLAGAIESRLGRHGDMVTTYGRAVARNPRNWYAQIELSVAASAVGDDARALRAARAAARLNPADELVQSVLRAAEEGKPLRPVDVDRALLAAPGPS